MKKWSYRAIKLARFDDLRELNDAGKSGWELVAIVPHLEGGFVAYLKRQKGGD